MTTRRILCAIDFSEASRSALDVAVDLARQRGAALVLVHVQEPPLWVREPYVHMPGDVRQDVRVSAARELEVWKREAEQRGAIDVGLRIADGAAWDEIVAIANADPSIEMVVLGTHGRSGIKRALIGSVAERVVRHAPCNVLVVRQRARA
jgi:universal stress protein A